MGLQRRPQIWDEEERDEGEIFGQEARFKKEHPEQERGEAQCTLQLFIH